MTAPAAGLHQRTAARPYGEPVSGGEDLSPTWPPYAPPGELRVDPDARLVQCHHCGRWFRKLPPHLHAAGIRVADYRDAYGLQATQPLQAPDLSAAQSVRWRARMATDQRVQAGMQAGLRLARFGELPTQGSQAATRPNLQRSARRAEQGRALGTARADRHRAAREQRARELGFASLEAYLQTRYAVDGGRVVDLAAELEAHAGAVVADMDRFGIPRRSRGERTRRAHQARRKRGDDARASAARAAPPGGESRTAEERGSPTRPELRTSGGAPDGATDNATERVL